MTAIERGRVVCAKQPFYMDLSDGEDHPPGGQHHRHTAPLEGEKKKVSVCGGGGVGYGGVASG